MQVLIVEDEAPAARRLKALLQLVAPESQVLDVVDSVEDTVKWLQHHPLPDLILMDIQLADGLSFAIFQQVDIRTPVIFTTAFDEYLLEAFKVNSIDYLLKPIKEEDLLRSITKLQQLQQNFTGDKLDKIEQMLQAFGQEKPQYKSRFLVKVGDKLYPIAAADIAGFRTEEKAVILTTHQGRHYVMDYTLDELESLLNPRNFFRLNRQFLVSLETVGMLQQHVNGKLLVNLVAPLNTQVIVSREKSPLLKEWLDR